MSANLAGRRPSRRATRAIFGVTAGVVLSVVAVGTPLVAAQGMSAADVAAVERTSKKPGWITNKPPMSGVPTNTWEMLVGPTQDPWRPRGKRIASTGFVPKRDGYYFLNYSNAGTSLPNRLNSYVFGGKFNNVANMGSEQLVSLFGRKNVCLGHRKGKTGTCVLTPGARAWMAAVNRISTGGHCFGLATTAAQLFNRQLNLTEVGGRTNTHSIPFKPAITRPVAQAFSLQTLARGTSVEPSQAIALLKKKLRKGRSPFTLTMSDNSGGGHAVTPIALHKRGQGKYDIAIYDNNYPDRVRAIHADTNVVPGTNREVGYDYELFTAPGQPPTKLAGDIELWNVNNLLGKFRCPFCLTANSTTIHLQPVATQTPVNVSVTAPGGGAISGLRTISPTNPWRPGESQPLPSFRVPKGQPFELVIDNGANSEPVITVVTVQTGELTWQLDYYELPPGSVDTVGVEPQDGLISFRTSQGSSPALTTVDHSSSFNPREIVTGPNTMDPGATFEARSNIRLGTYTFTPGPGASPGGAIELEQQRNVGGPVKFSTSGAPMPVTVPVDSQLVWNYLNWKLSQASVQLDVVGPGGTSSSVTVPLQSGTVN